jgi:hypothetical protein
MKTLLIIFTAGLMLAGCGGKNLKSMKYSEMRNLPEAQQKDLAKDLTMEDAENLMKGAMKYSTDTNALADKTIGDLIEEGKKASK